MAILPMVLLPDPLLRRRSAPIERVDDELRALARDMLETMYDAPGVGLAAVQIGVPRRLVTLDVREQTEEEREAGIEPPRDPIVMVNPEIVTSSDARRVHEEGCLSIPDYFAEVERPDTVRLRWTDLDGRQEEREVGGLFSTAAQHEIDHLDGALFIDRLSRLKRDRVVRKFVKMAKEAGRPTGGERPIIA